MLLKLNTDLIEKMAEAKGWSKIMLAQKLSISRMHLDRILNGDSCPGNKVISAMLATFPECNFNDLFFLPEASQKSDT